MLEGLVNRLKRISDSLCEDKILHDVLEDSTLQAQIVDLNQHQLYDLGLQSDGSPTGYYAPITISKWKPLAKAEGRDGRSDHITGKDTGETYASMKAVNLDKSMVITADDRNGFFDVETEGLGLTQVSLDEIKPEITESIIQNIREKIAA